MGNDFASSEVEDFRRIRRECVATMQRIKTASRELREVRLNVRRSREFVRWQEFFDYDPKAAEFFWNLARSDR